VIFRKAQQLGAEAGLAGEVRSYCWLTISRLARASWRHCETVDFPNRQDSDHVRGKEILPPHPVYIR